MALGYDDRRGWSAGSGPVVRSGARGSVASLAATQAEMRENNVGNKGGEEGEASPAAGVVCRWPGRTR